MSERFIQVDEEGYFLFDGIRVADAEYGRELLKNIFIDDGGRTKCRTESGEVWVEAFDEPFVATNLERTDSGKWKIELPYSYSEEFALTSLSLDEWDRFHGRTERGIPFVFSRAAQAEFFNQLEDFDDDSITDNGKRYEIGPWLIPNPSVGDPQFWNQIYKTEETPNWDSKGEPHPALPTSLPQLKITKSRILVLGAGSGSDAAYFARAGHIVTAVDFSEEAIARAKAQFGSVANLEFVQADVFNLPASFTGSFDIVFEHTLYCAISPDRRNELVKVWRRVLTDNGFLMGIFFAFEKRNGPPYGGSEWEIRARLGKNFRHLYWMRVKNSKPMRLGNEVFIYSQKLAQL